MSKTMRQKPVEAGRSVVVLGFFITFSVKMAISDFECALNFWDCSETVT